MRKSTVVQDLPTKEEAQEAFKSLAEKQAELNVVIAKMDQQIQRIKAKNDPKISSLQSEIDKLYLRVQSWAVENKQEEFGAKKSQDWRLGKIGFRLGVQKVGYLPRMSRKALGNLVDAGMNAFVRVKKEIDKDKILASKEDVEVMEKMRECGIVIKQDERFYIELKEEKLE